MVKNWMVSVNNRAQYIQFPTHTSFHPHLIPLTPHPNHNSPHPHLISPIPHTTQKPHPSHTSSLPHLIPPTPHPTHTSSHPHLIPPTPYPTHTSSLCAICLSQMYHLFGCYIGTSTLAGLLIK